jgi:carbon monoxide dehydrogenase subunit G
MTTITREVAIDATKDRVWDVVADFGAIDMVSPGVTNSYITSEQDTGVGTERHCDLDFMGASVEEKIIDWQEGESIKIDIYERKNVPLVRDMIAEFVVREEDGKTILSATLQYAMSGGVGNLMNAVMMKKMNTKTWNRLLAGFKKRSETGEKIDKNTVLDLGAVVEIES